MPSLPDQPCPTAYSKVSCAGQKMVAGSILAHPLPGAKPQAWPVSGQGGSVPSAGGWLDRSENAAPKPRGIVCMGDPGEAYPRCFAWLSYFS